MNNFKLSSPWGIAQATLSLVMIYSPVELCISEKDDKVRLIATVICKAKTQLSTGKTSMM
ncbi:hypothetical protein BDV36DRAFT_272816, partial [Aspergillus pseudocaelatus]